MKRRVLSALLFGLWACGDGDDGSSPPDGSPDASAVEAGTSSDAGVSDASGVDASTNPDADLPPDAGVTVRISGTLTGLIGGELGLTLNGTAALSLTADGMFEFDLDLPVGDNYVVELTSQPEGPAQFCRVDAPNGTASLPAPVLSVDCDSIVLYPGVADAWNDYIKTDGTSPLNATGVACDPVTDVNTVTGCFHAGSIRGFVVPNPAPCDQISARDSLGVFHWACGTKDGQTYVYTASIAAGMGLKNLIDPAGPSWRTPTVEVDNGGQTLTYESGPWWTNPIEVESGQLVRRAGVEGTVYIIDADRVGFLANLADRISVVVMPGVTVESLDRVVIDGEGASFVWVEGAFETSRTSVMVSLRDGAFAVIKSSTLVATNANGTLVELSANPWTLLEDVEGMGTLRLGQISRSDHTIVHRARSMGPSPTPAAQIDILLSDFVSVRDLSVDGVASQALIVRESVESRFSAIRVANAVRDSISIRECTDCVFTAIEVSGGTSPAFAMRDSVASRVSDLVVSAAQAGVQDSGCVLVTGMQSVLTNVHVEQCGQDGIWLEGGAHRISDSSAVNNTRNGFNFVSTDDAAGPWGMAARDVVAANNGAQGFMLSGRNHAITGAKSFNNGASGFVIDGSNIALRQVIATSNTAHGVSVQAGVSAVVMHATLAANGQSGLRTLDAVDPFVESVVSLFNGRDGLDMEGGSALRARNVIFSGNDRYGVRLDAASLQLFDWFGSGSNTVGQCRLIDGSIGLDVSMNCLPTAGDAIRNRGSDMPRSLVVGARTIEDPVNTSDTMSRAAIGAITDWTGFSRNAITWGPAATGVDSLRGRCTAGDCRLWDFSPALDMARNHAFSRTSTLTPNGDDNADTIFWFTAATPTSQSDCDTQVPGSTFDTDVCVTRLLHSAFEVAGDGIGNDNFYCESQEACVWAQNAGHDQGFGPATTVPFTDGMITSVQLSAPTTTGYGPE